jgi:hypothetical protein
MFFCPKQDSKNYSFGTTWRTHKSQIWWSKQEDYF